MATKEEMWLTRKVASHEKFMTAVCEKLDCEPCYGDPERAIGGVDYMLDILLRRKEAVNSTSTNKQMVKLLSQLKADCDEGRSRITKGSDWYNELVAVLAQQNH